MTALRFYGTVLPETEPRELFVVNGRIRTESVPGAQTVHEGGYLLPGFVDAHCHIGIGPDGSIDRDEALRQAETELRAGVLLVRDCGVPVDTSWLQRRLDLPRIIRSGQHLVRPKRYIPGLGLDVEVEDLPAEVARQAQAGDGWVKLVGDWIDRARGDLAPLWPDEVLVEAMQAAHENNARVTAHVFGAQALPGLINAGIDCIEHGTGLDDELLAEMARRGTALVPTRINIENFPAIAASATKYPVYAEHMRTLHRDSRDLVAKARRAGVQIYAGTDAGGMVEHGRIVDEIVALHEAGLTPTEAIGAASWRARSWLGFLGLQDSGAADLLVFDEDPRLDLEVLRSPTQIMLRGRVIASSVA